MMVYVDNENDNNPFFEQEFYPVDIDENLVSGTIVQMVSSLMFLYFSATHNLPTVGNSI